MQPLASFYSFEDAISDDNTIFFLFLLLSIMGTECNSALSVGESIYCISGRSGFPLRSFMRAPISDL